MGTPGLGLAGGSRCLTLAGRRARKTAPAWRVADHGALLQACGVRRRSSKEAQQRVVVAQGREGADSQLHLGKGRAAHARTFPPRPGVWAASWLSPTQGACPLLCSLAALLNVDPCPLESPLEPNSVSPAWDPLGHSWVCPGFSGAPQVTGDPTKDGVPVPRPAPTARSKGPHGPLVVSTTWVRSSLASTPARPTHLPLGLAAHVLRVGPGDGHAGLVAAPQPVAALISPGALCLPGAAARARGQP